MAQLAWQFDFMSGEQYYLDYSYVRGRKFYYEFWKVRETTKKLVSLKDGGLGNQTRTIDMDEVNEKGPLGTGFQVEKRYDDTYRANFFEITRTWYGEN